MIGGRETSIFQNKERVIAISIWIENAVQRHR